MTKAAELAKMGEVLTNSQIGGRRNIIINGGMNISQRATSATGLGGNQSYSTVDRFRQNTANTAGRFTMTQTADGPSGFANCMKLECTTADTSIAAGEVGIIQYKIEGQDVQQIKKGTSDAEKITISFYVKGNANATYVCELEDVDNTRNNTQAFNVTTSWTRVVLTFAADTTGALDDNNAESLTLNIWLHAGSTYSGGTFSSNTWASTTNANRYAGSRTSFFDSTDRTFFLTGLQMEIGSQATPFEHLSVGESLQLCKRYYNKQLVASSNFTMSGLVDGSRYSANVFQFSPPLRTAPTAIETSGTASDYAMRKTTTQALDAVPTFSSGDVNSTCFNMDKNGHGLTNGTQVFLRSQDADCFLAWSAEL